MTFEGRELRPTRPPIGEHPDHAGVCVAVAVLILAMVAQ